MSRKPSRSRTFPLIITANSVPLCSLMTRGGTLMRRILLILALVSLVTCDSPMSTSVPSAGTASIVPTEAEWVRDTVLLAHYSGGVEGDDFTPDTIFPFHIYWHRDGVPAPIRAAIRQAAALWASIVAPTEVLPYVFEYGWSCGFSEGVVLDYAGGDTLAGGFHVYVSSDPAVDAPHRAWAAGPCIPHEGDGWVYHPVTGAPPNGFTFIGRALQTVRSARKPPCTRSATFWESASVTGGMPAKRATV